MIKNILKGILLWTTILSIIAFIIAIDSLSLISIILWIAINIILIIVSNQTLTFEDVFYLSGSKLIDKILKL